MEELGFGIEKSYGGMKRVGFWVYGKVVFGGGKTEKNRLVEWGE